MKKMFRIMILFMAVLLTFTAEKALAQAPQGLNYQAVVRNSAGVAQISQPVGVQFKIRQGSVGGTLVYQEVFSPTTNSLGLMTLAIGQGTPQVGTFVTIDWSNSPYFLEVLIDPAGGTAYVSAGNTQFLSVPYALYSDSAGNGVSAFGGTGNTINLTLKDGSVLSYTVTGVSGPTGPQGPAGPAGPQGPTGSTGAAGPAGATGATGAAGPAGPIGNTGPAGPAGATGATGSAGTPGTNGLDGKTVLNGTSNPTGGTGVNGDFYINTTTSQIFGPKAGGVWPSGVSLVGPAGATGATGAAGPQGPTGDNNWTLSGSDIYSNNTGNVGVGLTAPLYKLQVTGTFLQSSGSAGFGAYDANFRVRIQHSTLHPLLITAGASANDALLVHSNRGLSIGDNGVNGVGFTVPPAQGLYVQGPSQLNSLTGTGNGIVRTSSTGLLSRINETSATDVLRGDGTFGPVPGGSLPTGINGQTLRFNGTTLEANSNLFNRPSDGFVGIGTASPLKQFTLLAPSATNAEIALLPGSNSGQTSKLWLGGRTDLTGDFATLNYDPTTDYFSIGSTPNTINPERRTFTMVAGTGSVAIGYNFAGNTPITPINSQVYIESDNSSFATNGILQVRNNHTAGYAALFNSPNAGAKGVRVQSGTGGTALEVVGNNNVATQSPAVRVQGGSMMLMDNDSKLIMKDVSGNCYSVTINPIGPSIQITAITCP